MKKPQYILLFAMFLPLAIQRIPIWIQRVPCCHTRRILFVFSCSICFQTIPVFSFAADLYQAEYQYDSRGFVTNLLETYEGGAAEGRELRYNALGRLVGEEIGAYQVQYEYDHLGNRLRQIESGAPPKSFQYNARNELLQQDPDGETRTFSYDLNGSLTQSVTEAFSRQYELDSRGRLRWVSNNGGEVFRADYAGDLKRLRKTEGATSRLYRHDGATAVQEVDEAGAVKDLVRGDRGASTVGGILYSADEVGTNTYTYNGVGSTVALSGEDGSVRIFQYDAFGTVMEGQENAGNERLANTKEFDESIGLYFHGARYYDATIGRYISMDPARDGANYYVYANNAPFTYVDPTGLAYSPSEHGSAAGDASVDLALGALTWLGETLDRGKVPPWIPGLGAASAVAAWRASAGITARAASAAARRAALRASGGEAAVKAAFGAVDDMPPIAGASSGAGEVVAVGDRAELIQRMQIHRALSNPANRAAAAEAGAEMGDALVAHPIIYKGGIPSGANPFVEGVIPKGGREGHTDLLKHLRDSNLPVHGVASGLTGTSFSPAVAVEFAQRIRLMGRYSNEKKYYIYIFRPNTGLEANKIVGPKSPYRFEYECTVPGGLRAADCLGRQLLDLRGRVASPLEINPNYPGIVDVDGFPIGYGMRELEAAFPQYPPAFEGGAEIYDLFD